MKYKYIFFDFNGTVLNDVDLCLQLLNEMLISCNHQKVSYDEYKHIFRFPVIEYYKLAGFDFTKESFNDLSKWFIENYQPKSLKCHLYDNVVNTFEYLISKGYKLVLLSASQIDNLIQQCNHFEITKYFDAILGIDNIYAASKVDIGVNYLVNNKIDPKEVSMIGDTLHDKEVAEKMGVNCFLVSCGHQHFDILNINENKVLSGVADLMKFL